LYEPAEAELDERSLRERYGPLVQGAVSAFSEDVGPLTEMIEHAHVIAWKRQMAELRAEALTIQRRGQSLDRIVQRLAAKRGISPPETAVRKR
jgi:hypothetical protein